MLFSKNWLQTYFDKELPSTAEIEQGIIFHSFEFEGSEKVGDDEAFEIKILPDRAHDCLCHRGVAGEIGTIFELDLKEQSFSEIPAENRGNTDRSLEVNIEDPKLCRRYIGRVVENIKIEASPKWLAERLEAVGQRSISNIVDATNYIMFSLGQPMHAFDADKVKGNITVRPARAGETMTTLDGRELALTPDSLLITDDEGPLALAGVKGGNRAEVDTDTKNIILESANFDPVNIRKTSQKFDLRTDASKRFENELSSEVAGQAMTDLSGLIYELAKTSETKFGEVVDNYPTPQKEKNIAIRTLDICDILGEDIPTEKIVDILSRLGMTVTQNDDTLNIKIPDRRMDLETKENIAEEVGRIYGYDHIASRLFPSAPLGQELGIAEKRYRIMSRVRETLVGEGYSELYGYSLVENGEVVLANPFASDKSSLRIDLTGWLADKTKFNLQHVLFDTTPVKTFEIGRIFRLTDGTPTEATHLAISVGYRKQKKVSEDNVRADLEATIAHVFEALNIPNVVETKTTLTAVNNDLIGVMELSFDELAEQVKEIPNVDLSPLIKESMVYKKVSSYPRVIRDIALFVPADTTTEEVAEIIRVNAGELLSEGPILFDVFEKKDEAGNIVKKSLAFRSVFQAYDRTLSDDEVNTIWDKVTSTLIGKGWEVR